MDEVELSPQAKLLLELAKPFYDTVPEFPSLNRRERLFVAEYAVDMNIDRARKAVGLKSKNGFRNGDVKRAMELAIRKREELSTLRAEYVRDYIRDILELCPTDYFVLSPDGQDWVIDPEEFQQLPKEVKRLVESVEITVVAGKRVFRVNFISKSTALAMAAKYTLTQHIDFTTTQIPWDQVVRPLEAAGFDAVEKRIKQVECCGPEGTSGPVRDAGGAVA